MKEGHCSFFSEDFEADLLEGISIVRLFWFDIWLFDNCSFFLVNWRRLCIWKIFSFFLGNNNLRSLLLLDNISQSIAFICVHLICSYSYGWAGWSLYKCSNIDLLAANAIYTDLLALHLHRLIGKIRVEWLDRFLKRLFLYFYLLLNLLFYHWLDHYFL